MRACEAVVEKKKYPMRVTWVSKIKSMKIGESLLVSSELDCITIRACISIHKKRTGEELGIKQQKISERQYRVWRIK